MTKPKRTSSGASCPRRALPTRTLASVCSVLRLIGRGIRWSQHCHAPRFVRSASSSTASTRTTKRAPRSCLTANLSSSTPTLVRSLSPWGSYHGTRCPSSSGLSAYLSASLSSVYSCASNSYAFFVFILTWSFLCRIRRERRAREAKHHEHIVLNNEEGAPFLLFGKKRHSSVGSLGSPPPSYDSRA